MLRGELFVITCHSRTQQEYIYLWKCIIEIFEVFKNWRYIFYRYWEFIVDAWHLVLRDLLIYLSIFQSNGLGRFYLSIFQSVAIFVHLSVIPVSIFYLSIFQSFRSVFFICPIFRSFWSVFFICPSFSHSGR